MKNLNLRPEEYKALLQSYVDRLDAELQQNEFVEAENILRELVDDVIRRFQNNILSMKDDFSYVIDILIEMKNKAEEMAGDDEEEGRSD